jgi:glycosyltransferase involved in cell wall biosynthesis
MPAVDRPPPQIGFENTAVPPLPTPDRSTQIVFISPSTAKLNGGIKYLFRMAETLRRAGYDAVICEAKRARPTWFESDAPIVGHKFLAKRANQVLVIPEDLLPVLQTCASWPQPKVMYCQNHFYAARTAPANGSYADLGISHILCSGRTIYDYCRHRHPGVSAHLIPCGVDPALFRPRPKRERIAYIPRKRPAEAHYIRDLFRFNYPEFRDVEWLPLIDKSEPEIATALGECSVFLALGRLEGFGLTPIEAMAAGCVVAGFTGVGGWEYATAENGFWAEEYDSPGCVRQLAEAVRLSRGTGAQRLAYSEACTRTAARYTPAAFDDAIRAAWAQILTQHA